MNKFSLIFLFSLLANGASAQLAGGLMFPGPGTPASSGNSMTTPIIGLGNGGIAPSTTAATFFPLVSGSNNGSSVSNVREQPIAVPGTISNLFVSFPSGIGSGNWSVALTLNGTITTLTCQVSGTTCSDVHSVAILASDTVGWTTCPGTISGATCTPGTAPTANTNFQVSATFASTNANESFVIGSSATPSTTVFNYASLQGFSTYTTTEANFSSIIPVAGVLDQLYINLVTAAGVAKSWTFTIMQNGVATTLSCNAANTTTCTDLNVGHAITFSANDTVSFQACPGTVAASVCTSLGPTSSAVKWGMRWKPTTSGQSLLLLVNQNTMPSTTATTFSLLNGSGTGGATETNNQNIGPISFTIQNLSVAFSTAPGAAQSRTFTLRTGTGGSQISSALTCNVTNSTSVTSCQDNTHSASITSGLFMDWQNAETGTPAAVTNHKISSVMTVP